MSDYRLKKHRKGIIKDSLENTSITQQFFSYSVFLVPATLMVNQEREISCTWRDWMTALFVWMFRSVGGWRVRGVTRWSRSIYWNTHKVFCAPSFSDKWSPSYLLLLNTHNSVEATWYRCCRQRRPDPLCSIHLVSLEPVHNPRVFLTHPPLIYCKTLSETSFFLFFNPFLFLFIYLFIVFLWCVFFFYESTAWTFIGDKYLEMSKGGLQGMSNAAIYRLSLCF